ncbi:hypothetical protein K505DRAFT_367033, partial [Melanomma pulvis-pyrius CBS 109.77]
GTTVSEKISDTNVAKKKKGDPSFPSSPAKVSVATTGDIPIARDLAQEPPLASSSAYISLSPSEKTLKLEGEVNKNDGTPKVRVSSNHSASVGRPKASRDPRRPRIGLAHQINAITRVIAGNTDKSPSWASTHEKTVPPPGSNDNGFESKVEKKTGGIIGSKYGPKNGHVGPEPKSANQTRKSPQAQNSGQKRLPSTIQADRALYK